MAEGVHAMVIFAGAKGTSFPGFMGGSELYMVVRHGIGSGMHAPQVQSGVVAF